MYILHKTQCQDEFRNLSGCVIKILTKVRRGPCLPETHCFKGDVNFDMFPKKMGKKLQNELWARPVASKLSERRPLTFFNRQDTDNGQKRYFFAFLQIAPMRKFSGGFRGCHMKADILEIPKMW